MKIKKYICIAFGALMLQGCYPLDLTPGNQFSDKTFWQNEEQVKEGLVGVYAAMKSNWAFGLTFAYDMIADTSAGYEGTFLALSQGQYAANNGAAQNHWQYLYEMIARANTVIANVDGMDEGVMARDKKNAAIAEARFLRALAYFRLLDFYGGVPWYDEATDVGASFATMFEPRSSAEDIRAKVIDDLNFAIADLPVAWPPADYGRATKGAAYALRGKVRLYNREWPGAIADFEEIVYNKSNDYGYALHESYADLFQLYNGAKSPETILALQSRAGGTNYGLTIGDWCGNKCTLRNISGNVVIPSSSLVDLYEFPDGKPFDWDDIYPGFSTATPAARRDMLAIKLAQDGKSIESLLQADTAKVASVYRQRDPRLGASIITPYSQYYGTTEASVPQWKWYVLHNTDNNGGNPLEGNGYIRNGNGNVIWTTYFWRKFVPTGNLNGYWHDYQQTPFEFSLIRLGDVLLMLAEAYNETDQLDKAITELNKVRARVGMPGLNSGAQWMAVTSKEQMTQRIRKERAVELANEGHRYSDLRRWGIAAQVLNGRNETSIYGDRLYTQGFADRQMLFPIPQIEIERNKENAITQNPGW